ncbi:MAG: N-6 DNA methylase [Desulfomonilia bacterium]|jgi:hypothetical protein
MKNSKSLSQKTLKPYSDSFEDILYSYYEQIVDAIKYNKHHDQRRNLLIDFFRRGLSLDPVEFELEHKIKVHEIRGRIDAFFRHLIIEVKTDLEHERNKAKDELIKYFESQSEPNNYVGIVTDGINFEIYIYEDNSVYLIRQFRIDPDNPLSTFLQLDELFYTSRSLTPSSSDIIGRFGLTSTTYNALRRSLTEAFNVVKNNSAVKVKYSEWNSLLSKVYGSEIGDQHLFITHTYLAMLSRAIVALTLFPKKIRDHAMCKGIIDGAFFKQNRFSNLAEPDFFSWPLDTTIEDKIVNDVENLFRCLAIYNFKTLNEDILKELYQKLVDPASRHELGEYYTPDWLAELILDKINYTEGRLLDPSCGSGTFLYAAAKRLKLNSRLKKEDHVQAVVDSIIGIDVHPVAVLMAKANLLLSLRDEILSYKGDIHLQVYMADTLMTGEDSRKNCLAIHVTKKKEAFLIPYTTLNRGAKATDAIIDMLSDFAKRGSKEKEKEIIARKGFKTSLKKELSNDEITFWSHNFTLFLNLEKEGKNTIWAYILKNAYRPSYLRLDKVDFIVGNPPWLAYAFVNNDAYKARIKELVFAHGLLLPSDRKLFTRMDTSTLFYDHCQRDFLKTDGTIAFVMPKTTILPAKQHLRFQSQGFTELLDFESVKPLFNVPCCVVVRRNANLQISEIPITRYFADFKGKRNICLSEAEQSLTKDLLTHNMIQENVDFSPYHPKFYQGATLTPRSFWFVEPVDPQNTNITSAHPESIVS